MTQEVQVFDVPRMSRDLLGKVRVGDWFWIKFDDTKWDEKKEEHVPNGSHEELMCVEEIGSNYLGFTVYEDRHSNGTRVHFNEFLATCREEPNWKAILNQRMEDARKAIQDKTQELILEGQKVCLIAQEASPEVEQSLLPAKVSEDPKKYKKDLMKLQKKLPEISKDISELGDDFAVAAKNIALPDMVKLGAIKKVLEVVEDRIFTVELYCGILEEVEQIAKGTPAPIETPVVIRQQLLYMDEETIFDYETGGMDFNKIGKFDEWVVKPQNLERILPEKRGVVAFRVRRNSKDYGEARDLAMAWAHMEWKRANEQTYILIRNGENVYRIASDVDFSPRLIPKINEIGADQFKKIDERLVWDEKDENGFTKRIVTETMITQDDVKFDDHMKKVENLLKHYNRIVILIQGLLDRSMVFHPHAPINLRNQKDMEKWVVLLRDEEMGLPSNKVDWAGYRNQLNSSIKIGKWICIDSAYDEKWKDGKQGDKWDKPKRGYYANVMPDFCQVDGIKKDRSKVRVSWPQGRLSKPRQGKWIDSPTRPGYGHYETIYETDRMCHEWLPIGRVMNVSDYNLGDYKMFLCDRTLQGEYLRWAKYLIKAEDWARDRAKGIPAEDDPKSKVREM